MSDECVVANTIRARDDSIASDGCVAANIIRERCDSIALDECLAANTFRERYGIIASDKSVAANDIDSGVMSLKSHACHAKRKGSSFTKLPLGRSSADMWRRTLIGHLAKAVGGASGWPDVVAANAIR